MSESFAPEELAAMREVAEAAAKWAPGSWEWGEMGHALWAEGDDGPILDVCSDDRKPVPAEAKHIAAFDPPTVLRLLGEIADLNDSEDELCAKIKDLSREGAQLHSDATELAEELEAVNGETLAYQTRIEKDAVRMAEKDAEIERLQSERFSKRQEGFEVVSACDVCGVSIQVHETAVPTPSGGVVHPGCQ